MSIDPQIEKGVRDAVALAVLAEHFTESRGREVLGVGIRAFRAILRDVQEEYLTPQELTPLPKPEVDILPFLREMAGGKAVTRGTAEQHLTYDEFNGLLCVNEETWRELTSNGFMWVEQGKKGWNITEAGRNKLAELEAQP